MKLNIRRFARTVKWNTATFEHILEVLEKIILICFITVHNVLIKILGRNMSLNEVVLRKRWKFTARNLAHIAKLNEEGDN